MPLDADLQALAQDLLQSAHPVCPTSPLLHLFQNQVHHRGQAHAMLSGTSVPPLQLDEFFPAGEAPLRAAEFSALGWSETTVWSDVGAKAQPSSSP